MTGFYQIDERTARKDHQCRECRTYITPGDTYYEQRHVHDGRWSRMKFCAPCQSLINRCCRENGPDSVEIVEYVFGYHDSDQIADDPELLGFVIRYEKWRENRIACIAEHLANKAGMEVAG